eukprot:c342_g1_i1.p1 GENE.c342_g1_i1~~c342_g1_i1.p1  ORF type:complete len:260 (+),score=17.66 c342_g1_i1:93-782(+)
MRTLAPALVALLVLYSLSAPARAQGACSYGNFSIPSNITVRVITSFQYYLALCNPLPSAYCDGVNNSAACRTNDAGSRSLGLLPPFSVRPTTNTLTLVLSTTPGALSSPYVSVLILCHPFFVLDLVNVTFTNNTFYYVVRSSSVCMPSPPPPAPPPFIPLPIQCGDDDSDTFIRLTKTAFGISLAAIIIALGLAFTCGAMLGMHCIQRFARAAVRAEYKPIDASVNGFE